MRFTPKAPTGSQERRSLPLVVILHLMPTRYHLFASTVTVRVADKAAAMPALQLAKAHL